MVRWSEFAAEAPDIASAGRRRLVGADGVAIGFLATVSARGAPRLAPVCPIFCGDNIYLSVGGHTPKARDLRASGRYVLHGFLGANDEEFQMSGDALEVHEEGERAAVHRAIPFKAFKASDPIFRLSIEQAQWVHWDRVGQPDTRPVRQAWSAGRSAGDTRRSVLAREIREAARIRGTFTLRSGAVSDTYFDKYLFESEPRLLREIARHMAPLVPAGTEVLCGLEMGGIPVVTVLSQVIGLPAAFIRKERKSYGTEKYAEGPTLVGRSIVLVEDVVSTGGALLDAAARLRADGVAVAVAVCVIDRQRGGRGALAKAGIELRAVFTMDEIEAAV